MDKKEVLCTIRQVCKLVRGLSYKTEQFELKPYLKHAS